MQPSKCRSCGAEIIWVKMKKTGKFNPLDVKPVPNGNVTILHTVGDASVAETVAKSAHGLYQSLYVSHFATCPNRAQHRKADK